MRKDDESVRAWAGYRGPGCNECALNIAGNNNGAEDC